MISIFTNFVKKLLQLRMVPKYRVAFSLLVGLIVFGTLGIYHFEHGINQQFASLTDGLWWSFVTISTVGYGDKYPLTAGGRIVGLVMMFGGIGTFGYLAGALIEHMMQRRRGQAKLILQDHYIICNYNNKVKGIVQEIYGEERNASIVLVGLVEENPLEELGVSFVRGDSADEETLHRAGVLNARAAIVLASEKFDFSDSHSVLTTLAVRHLNPSIKITAEALDVNNEPHLRRAGADEVIVSDRILGRMIARSNFYDKGFNFIRELITTTSGATIYDAAVEGNWVGKRCEQIYAHFKSRRASLLAVYRAGKMISLPDDNMETEEGDHLIYISHGKIPMEIGGPDPIRCG